MANKTTLAVLLSADRGKLKLQPTRQVEITRLSEIVGEPVIFTIRALTGDELTECQEAAMRADKGGDGEEMDSRMMQVMCVLYACKDPNIRSKELMDAYEAATPVQLLNGDNPLLLPGEVSHLFTVTQELSGFGEGAVAEVKN